MLVRPEAPTLVTHLFIPSQARESVASAKLEADVVIIVVILIAQNRRTDSDDCIFTCSA